MVVAFGDGSIAPCSLLRSAFDEPQPFTPNQAAEGTDASPVDSEEYSTARGSAPYSGLGGQMGTPVGQGLQPEIGCGLGVTTRVKIQEFSGADVKNSSRRPPEAADQAHDDFPVLVNTKNPKTDLFKITYGDFPSRQASKLKKPSNQRRLRQVASHDSREDCRGRRAHHHAMQFGKMVMRQKMIQQLGFSLPQHHHPSVQQHPKCPQKLISFLMSIGL
jgi:hypothetical protein